MKQLYYKNIYYLYYTPTPWRSVTRRAPSRGWSRMHSESDSTMLIHSDQTHTNSQSHQTRAQSAEQSRNGYIPKLDGWYPPRAFRASHRQSNLNGRKVGVKMAQNLPGCVRPCSCIDADEQMSKLIKYIRRLAWKEACARGQGRHRQTTRNGCKLAYTLVWLWIMFNTL